MNTYEPKSRKRTIWKAVASAALVVAGVVGFVQPASANSQSVTGQIDIWNGSTEYGDVERINSQVQNEVRFDLTGGPGGGEIDIYTVNPGATQFLSINNNVAFNTWYTFKYIPTGSIVWPNGGFYMAWVVNDQCGGSGCSPDYWTGDLEWNLPY